MKLKKKYMKELQGYIGKYVERARRSETTRQPYSSHEAAARKEFRQHFMTNCIPSNMKTEKVASFKRWVG